jgi:hypothetical protein
MKSILTAAALAAALAALGPGPAFAQQYPLSDHLAQAADHINTALAQTGPGQMPALVKHNQTALEHLRMAQQQKPSPDLQKAIDSLEQAIREGQSGGTEKAIEHTKESVEYIDAAKAALGG